MKLAQILEAQKPVAPSPTRRNFLGLNPKSAEDQVQQNPVVPYQQQSPIKQNLKQQVPISQQQSSQTKNIVDKALQAPVSRRGFIKRTTGAVLNQFVKLNPILAKIATNMGTNVFNAIKIQPFDDAYEAIEKLPFFIAQMTDLKLKNTLTRVWATYEDDWNNTFNTTWGEPVKRDANDDVLKVNANAILKIATKSLSSSQTPLVGETAIETLKSIHVILTSDEIWGETSSDLYDAFDDVEDIAKDFANMRSKLKKLQPKVIAKLLSDTPTHTTTSKYDPDGETFTFYDGYEDYPNSDAIPYQIADVVITDQVSPQEVPKLFEITDYMLVQQERKLQKYWLELSQENDEDDGDDEDSDDYDET